MYSTHYSWLKVIAYSSLIFTACGGDGTEPTTTAGTEVVMAGTEVIIKGSSKALRTPLS